MDIEQNLLKERIDKSMKYAYFDLARIKQSNGLSDEIALDYERTFARLLGIALKKDTLTWKGIFYEVKKKIFKTGK